MDDLSFLWFRCELSSFLPCVCSSALVSRLGAALPHSVPSSFLIQLAHEPHAERRGCGRSGTKSYTLENLAGRNKVITALNILRITVLGTFKT